MFGKEGPGWVLQQVYDALDKAGLLDKLICYDIENPIKYDRKAMKDIEPCRVFVAGLGSSLSQIRKAHKLGAKTLLLQFSTHHLHQQRVLQDIYARYGRKQFGLELYRILKEYNQSDYFLVLSEFCKYTYILNGISPEKVFVVHPGVDVKLFKYAEPNSDFKVLFIGTNPIRKGLPLLLKAWKELDIKGELIVRSGLSSVPIKNVVNMSQWLSENEVVGLYHQSSLTILPSLEEGFAGTNLESMACGRPVITTNVTGLEDVITNYKESVLIPPNDTKAIKDAILHFYDNRDELVRMGKEARVVAEKATWAKFREGVVGAVKKILE